MFAKTKHEPAKQSRGSSPFSHSAKTAHCPSLAQASLEYLLTYGWALILIATIVGVLVLIVSTPSGYACSRGLGRLICKAFGAQGEDLIITLQNATGQDISINPFSGIAFDGRAGYAIITYRGQQYRFEPATISKGDTFTITGIGLGNAGTASITYTETQTGMTRTETINLDTPQQETCNNGTDDDADDLVDCADTECETECTYVETTGTWTEADLTIPAGTPKTYTFNSTIQDDKEDSFEPTTAQFSFYIEGTGIWDLTIGFIDAAPITENFAAGQWYTRELDPISKPTMNTDPSRTFTLTNNSTTESITISAPVATIKVEKRELP